VVALRRRLANSALHPIQPELVSMLKIKVRKHMRLAQGAAHGQLR